MLHAACYYMLKICSCAKQFQQTKHATCRTIHFVSILLLLIYTIFHLTPSHYCYILVGAVEQWNCWNRNGHPWGCFPPSIDFTHSLRAAGLVVRRRGAGGKKCINLNGDFKSTSRAQLPGRKGDRGRWGWLLPRHIIVSYPLFWRKTGCCRRPLARHSRTGERQAGM